MNVKKVKSKRMTPMTPNEFAEKMRECIDKSTRPIGFIGNREPYLDPEDCHVDMDELMCKVLVQLGYYEGVDIFQRTEKYYS